MVAKTKSKTKAQTKAKPVKSKNATASVMKGCQYINRYTFFVYLFIA